MKNFMPLMVVLAGMVVFSGCGGGYVVVPPVEENISIVEEKPTSETPMVEGNSDVGYVTQEPDIEIPEEPQLPSATGEKIELVGDKEDVTGVSPLELPTYISETQPIESINWITPAKVEVGNFYAGARAECPLYIHNGNKKETRFTIIPSIPHHNWEGYVDAPLGYENWVFVEASGIVLAPRETRGVMVALEVPSDVVISTPKWEFWIVAAEDTGEMVSTQMACRWLITMR